MCEKRASRLQAYFETNRWWSRTFDIGLGTGSSFPFYPLLWSVREIFSGEHNHGGKLVLFFNGDERKALKPLKAATARVTIRFHSTQAKLNLCCSTFKATQWAYIPLILLHNCATPITSVRGKIKLNYNKLTKKHQYVEFWAVNILEAKKRKKEKSYLLHLWSENIRYFWNPRRKIDIKYINPGFH